MRDGSNQHDENIQERERLRKTRTKENGRLELEVENGCSRQSQHRGRVMEGYPMDEPIAGW